MKKFWFILIITLVWANAQSQTVLEGGTESDPKAVELLEALKKKVMQYQSITLDFEVKIEMPRQEKSILQKGQVIQQGNQYKLDTEGQTIFCNGKSLWIYAKALNEVQINDFDRESAGISTPLDIINIYDGGQYIFALTMNGRENGRSVSQIEFKPSSRVSDFSKLRLVLDTKTKEIIRLKTFEKDGTRMTFNLSKMKSNTAYESSTFEFDPSCCPDVYIEDLRLD